MRGATKTGLVLRGVVNFVKVLGGLVKVSYLCYYVCIF